MTMHVRAERLSLYLDNGLTLAERHEVNGHIRACAGCRHELETLRHIDSVLASWGSVRTPMPVQAQRRITGSVARRSRVGPIIRLSKMMPAAVGTSVAALLVLVSVNLGMLQNGANRGVQSAAPPNASLAKQSQRLIAARRSSAILGVVSVQPQTLVRHTTLADAS